MRLEKAAIPFLASKHGREEEGACVGERKPPIPCRSLADAADFPCHSREERRVREKDGEGRAPCQQQQADAGNLGQPSWGCWRSWPGGLQRGTLCVLELSIHTAPALHRTASKACRLLGVFCCHRHRICPVCAAQASQTWSNYIYAAFIPGTSFLPPPQDTRVSLGYCRLGLDSAPSASR